MLLAALAVQVLQLVALVTHGPGTPDRVGLVGVVGHWLSKQLYGGFGIVSYLFVVPSLYTTGLALVRREISTPGLRLVGGALAVTGACTLIFQFWDYD